MLALTVGHFAKIGCFSKIEEDKFPAYVMGSDDNKWLQDEVDMILCAGECLIDMLPSEVDGVSMLRPAPGGAVMNTAVALGRQDVPVQFVTGISHDQFGRLIQDHLADSHVGLDWAVQSDRPTTLAFVDVTDGVVSYNFYDENTAGRIIEPCQLPTIPAAVTALFFGGISLISEPAADSYADLLLHNAEGRVVMMDPNIRPAFIKDESAYRARLTKMLALTDIVKTSDEDLEWLYPDAPNIDAAIQELLNSGPKVVLFTEGAKGATAYRQGKNPVFVASEKVKVVDTVGAGDTFNGGFLTAMHYEDMLDKSKLSELTDAQLSKALGHAAKCAAFSVARAGAQPPRRADVF